MHEQNTLELTCTLSAGPDAAPFDESGAPADPADTLSWVAIRTSPPVGVVRAATLVASVGMSVAGCAEISFSNEAASGQEGELEVFVVIREGRPPRLLLRCDVLF